MTKATLVKEAFNWGLLTVSEAQSTIIMVGSRPWACCRLLNPQSSLSVTHLL